MTAATNFEQERHALDAVLRSGIFGRAPSLEHMLLYICRRYFDGEAAQLKEYSIAVEALGRPSDFDQNRDSIVRVEAHRLRKRLKEFYDGPGADWPVRIEIPPGQYAPQFVKVAPAAAEERPVTSTVAVIAAAPAALPPHRRWMLTAAAGATGLLLLAMAWNGAHTAARAAGPRTPTLPAATDPPLRILAGTSHSYIDTLGRVWLPDRYFEGGAGVSEPGHTIAGTSDPRLYQSHREGTFRYDIPLRPGAHELALHFAETARGDEASRLFDVRVNGQKLLDGIDVATEAGPNNADIRIFKDIAPAADGVLHLRFDPVIGAPVLSAIEITPSEPGRMHAVRMGARELGALRHGTDARQTIYWVPVARGRYAVTIEFARMFSKRGVNVFCNGVPLSLGAAGLRQTFHGLEPNAQGRLVLGVTPVEGTAAPASIEVSDESQ